MDCNNFVKNEFTVEEIKKQKKEKIKKKWRDAHIGSQFVMLLVILFICVPMYIMLITSFTSETESANAAFTWWPKGGLTLDGYKRAFTKQLAAPSLLKSFWNTMWIYIPSVVIGVFMSAMAAFAFAKLDFTLNKPLFGLLMTGLTLPNCMGTIASFLMFDKIGWINTPLPLMIPKMVGTVGIIFFLRQFYMGIPDDLIGAGYIDGLGELGVFFYIMLPVSVPALLSQGILQFIAAYNEYIGPLIYIQDSELYTLQITLAFFTDAYVQNWSLQMAGAVIAMTPLIILYLLSQKFILKGVGITSGLKG